MAGFKERLAVEWNSNAVETFKLNFDGVPVYHGDITKLTVKNAMAMMGIKKGELDILDGSPPCQGFSQSGRRDINDSRNKLFEEYVRLVKGMQAKVLVMENVAGMVRGKMKLIFADCFEQLENAGYQVSARLMDAGYFNVPQHRKRLIFIGVRNDLKIKPSHPKPQARPITVGTAFRGIVNTPEEIKAAEFNKKSTLFKWLMRLKQGQCASDLHPTGSFFSLRRLSLTNPSWTILKSGGSGACHPTENRRLTIPELKRIGSFPDNFILKGNFGQQWGLIGNSVPPLFMKAIAEHIKTEILDKCPVRD